MAKYEWSEVFMSIEGEARWAGHPTVYVRFARCNFQCKGFNNPTNDVQADGYATLGFEPKDFKTLQEIPLIHRGCDSQYAVNDMFSHMWGQGDENALAAEVLKVLPHGTFQNPVTGKRVILSLTGGEPTIRLKFWVPLLEILYNHGMRTILVETNCAAPMRTKDVEALFAWATGKANGTIGYDDRFYGNDDSKVKIVWSNSPKLSSSGESWDKAIRPDIATKQIGFEHIKEDDSMRGFLYNAEGFVDIEQYFKFVCGPNQEDFEEVKKALDAYAELGIENRDVYIMPVACTEEQQQEIAAKVAAMCIDKGYIYCHRIQNSVFGNGVGT